MDKNLMTLCLLGCLVIFLLMFLALFAMSPIFCTSVGSLLYTLYYFISNEAHEVHNAQEFENRFWTIFAVLLSTAVIFAKDSPLAFGMKYPSLGFISVLFCGYGMHVWDRNMHRVQASKLVSLRRGATAKSLDKLHELGIPIEDQLEQINSLMADLDQFYIPSTINNLVNKGSVIRNERKIISIFEEAQPKALNFLIGHSRLALIFYKIKDHRSFNHQHRTQLIELLAIERISQLTVHSKVIVLHALQMMKLPANTRAEYCVKNIITNTKQDELSDLKTLTDAKGDYFCMTKLLYDDIKSDTVREIVLKHIEGQARIQSSHMIMGTKRSKERKTKFWRKVLSDVDDTLTCSAGSYPSGIDKRYGKKIVYPGVLGFYRELDLGKDGPEEWPDQTVGNLVFLSARPHVYKDVSEKINFKKFEKLLQKRGMHTMPSLLAGDVNSGLETLMKNDFEPLAQKKFDNFRKYVSIYPEFRHVFVCDNGQGDVRAAELMVEAFPRQIEAIYVHAVQKISSTYKYSSEKWSKKAVRPFFFTTYPEAALHAASHQFIRPSGLRRICIDAINDFYLIQTKEWPSMKHKMDRRDELNQALWSCNQYLRSNNHDVVSLLEAEQLWKHGEMVLTPFGTGKIISFNSVFNLYEILLDWRSIDEQIADHDREIKIRRDNQQISSSDVIGDTPDRCHKGLDTVFELVDEDNINSYDLDKEQSITSSQSIPSNESPYSFTHIPSKGKRGSVTATIQGRLISKFKPPIRPSFPKDDASKSEFSFWGTKGDDTIKTKPKVVMYVEGEKCMTPYGPGVVLAYREESGIVVLKMKGWTATCYLSASIVKSKGEGFFESLIRKMTSPDNKPIASRKPNSSTENNDVEIQSDKQYKLLTPYGEGRVIQSLTSPTNSAKVSLKSSSQYKTIAIELTSWTLANNTHPTLYCTDASASHWKIVDDRSKTSNGIISAFISLGKKLITKTVPAEIKVSSIERSFKDGAAVTTPFGDGRVNSFREGDGFYEVYLTNWKLANKTYAKIFLNKESLTYKKAPGCHEGCAVLTSFGIPGILQSIQPSTGVHIVTIPLGRMVCYLQPSDIICPLKAIGGDDVLTQYGNGRVLKYRVNDNIYEISLGWGASLYAKAEAFDRDNSNLDDRGGLNMGWVLRLFYSSKNNSFGQRSRSNSVSSLMSQHSSRI